MGSLRPNAVIEVGFNAKSQSGIPSSHSPLPERLFSPHAIRPGGIHSRHSDVQAHRTDLNSITQHINIEWTVGVEPEVVPQWHTTHGLENLEKL